jgi:hypothetical protein
MDEELEDATEEELQAIFSAILKLVDVSPDTYE